MIDSTRLKILIAASGIAMMLAGCSGGSQRKSESIGAEKAGPRPVAVCEVVAQVLSKQARLPADLTAFRDIGICPKVQGFIDWIGVDRGSVVKKGQLLIRMTAPELPAQTKEGVDQARAAQDEAVQSSNELDVARQELEAAKAKLKADSDTYRRMKEASSYPGIIAGNDLELSQKKAEADAANVRALENKCKSLEFQFQAAVNKGKAARDAAASTRTIESYLRLSAPFDGVITERNVHEGSFVHPPASSSELPLLRLRQNSILRLVVPVPEMEVGGIVPGSSVQFTVSPYPGERFTGSVRRIGESVDVDSRTMPVELDVVNSDGRLAPGMFAEVIWPVRRKYPTLFVPQSAVVKTTERTFVIRVRDGVTRWLDVKPGYSADNLVEVFGDLKQGDLVVVRGTDELREGTKVTAKIARGT